MQQKLSLSLALALVLALGQLSFADSPKDWEEDSFPDPAKGSHEPKFPGVGNYDAWKSSLPELHKGMEFMKAGKWDDAIERFRASLALYPYEAKCWMQIGRATEAKGGLITDAEDAYRQALKIDSNNWRGWKRLANVLYVQKRYQDARVAISNALNMKVPPQARQEMDKMIRTIDSVGAGGTYLTPQQ